MRIGVNDELFLQASPGMHIKLRGKTDDAKDRIGDREWWLIRIIKGRNILALAPGKRVWIKGPNCPEFEVVALNTGDMIITGRQ